VRVVQRDMEGLRVVDVEVQGIKLSGDGNEANVFVQYLSTAANSISAAKTVQIQHWVHRDHGWKILSATSRKGQAGIFLFGDRKPR